MALVHKPAEMLWVEPQSSFKLTVFAFDKSALIAAAYR